MNSVVQYDGIANVTNNSDHSNNRGIGNANLFAARIIFVSVKKNK